MLSKISFSFLLVCFACNSGCSPITGRDNSVLGLVETRCNFPHDLVPTEAAAKDIYMAVYKAYMIRESGARVLDGAPSLDDTFNRLRVRHIDGIWHVTYMEPGTENLTGGGGFGISVNGCDGKVLFAGHVH